MPAVYGKIKKKEAYKSASYTTIQKLLSQNRITSAGTRRITFAEDWGELKLWYALSTCHDCTSTGKETNLFYGHKFGFAISY